MVRVILYAVMALWALLATAGPVTEDKYLGPEPFKRFTVAECRVTEFNPYDFHFRCTSQVFIFLLHFSMELDVKWVLGAQEPCEEHAKYVLHS